MNESLSKRSQDIVWHPFTQMNLAKPPIGIVKGKGAYLYDENDQRYLDAISSWWTNIHGHCHPYITQEIEKQASQLDHVIFAGFTHESAIRISERLIKKLGCGQERVFFSDNGSTAVEVGLKMAFQYWHNKDQAKTKVIAFKESYHGDTFGAMSVGDRSIFTKPFAPFLFDVEFVDSPAKDAEACKAQIKALVNKGDVAAIIYEPLVQGSCGMLMYSPECLDEIMEICQSKDVLCIADEVMTGFYRTGKFMASHYLKNSPDIFCLSKGLTGGVMAMSVTTCSEKIYKEFLSDSFMSKTFFHGHSFTANPIACRVANASLDLLEMDDTQERIQNIVTEHAGFVTQLKTMDAVENVRQQGTIVAFDIVTNESTNYGNSVRDSLYDHFMKQNILLRPLGNTLYILPPYCITSVQLHEVYEAIFKLLKER